MVEKKIRVGHYINQFFGGVGGEEAAGTGVQVRDGPAGPGQALDKALGDRADIVVTIVCGDNFFNEETDKALSEILPALEEARIDVLVAGPAFNSGRYGMACGRVCQAFAETLARPSVAAMHPDNPAVEQYRRSVYILPTEATAAGMGKAVPQLAGFAHRLASGVELGTPAEEGYIPKGVRRNVFRETIGAERALAMLVAKLRGDAFVSEIDVRQYDAVEPSPPIADLKEAALAIVTEAGIVPVGNPDHIEWARATKWRKYSIAGVSDLTGKTHEAVHGGFDNTWANEDPDRLLGVDVLRDLEREGTVGRLHDDYYVTVGNGTGVDVMNRMAREIADELKAARVDCAVIPAT